MTKEDLINLGIKYFEKYNKLPIYSKEPDSLWKKRNGYTGLLVVTNAFGSWQNFINALSFLENRPKIILIGEIKTKKELAIIYLDKVSWPNKQINKENYINCISDDTLGRLRERLNLSSYAMANINKVLFPDKTGNTTPISYIVNYLGYKYCPKCSKCLLISNFYDNQTKANKKSNICKICRATYQKDNKGILKYSMAKRNDKIKNTLIPSERQQIIEFYQKCPPKYHVDHIKPIAKGGTHTIDNLQYLTALENMKKGSKY